jgi:dienelactone hydrolase
MAITVQTVEYRDGDTPLSGLLFADSAQQQKRPGLLLVHHGAGLDEHTKEHAGYYAQRGFVVFACDMYGPGIAGSRERTMAYLMEMRGDPAKLVQRARAGLDVLQAHPQLNGFFGAIGYCFGGMAVLQMARNGVEFAGVVSVHGSLATTLPSETGSIKAKILVCHGALDPHVPMANVDAFVEEMKHASVDWQLIMYGEAVHGFTYKGASQNPGVAYNAAADQRSTVAINDFFAEVFGSSLSATT